MILELKFIQIRNTIKEVTFDIKSYSIAILVAECFL